MNRSPDGGRLSNAPQAHATATTRSAYGLTDDEPMQLLLREVTHRCANDLQLVASMLQLQRRKASNPEVQEALEDAANRVNVLAKSRDHARRREPTLESALKHVCAALGSQTEPQSVLMTLEFSTMADGLSDDQITCLALCVNELATNAIKHGCAGGSGHIAISVGKKDDGRLTIAVEDDGAPFAPKGMDEPTGLGLDLIRRLLQSIDGELREPDNGSKRFEIVVAPEGE